MSGTRPIKCQTIAEKGFKCPKYVSGKCPYKAPAALCYQPMSIEGLRDIVSKLPVSDKESENFTTAANFITEYMYNQDVLTEVLIIDLELKEHFRLSNSYLKSLETIFKDTTKKYQSGLNQQKHKIEHDLPLWYIPYGNSLKFMPGILAENLVKTERIIYSAEQHYSYVNGVYQPIDEMEAQRICQKNMLPSETKMYQIVKKELLETEKIHEIRSKNDEDAKFGHKTVSNTFFGYKNHMAMTEERIITAVKVTDGAQPDRNQLTELIDKTITNGVNVDEVIGDMAYVSDDNLINCEERNVTLYAKTNAAVSASAKSELEKGFWFNKDAGLLQCPAGWLATRVEKRKSENGNTYLNYCFSKAKYKNCPQNENCRVGKSKGKTYSITQVSEKNKKRLDFEETEIFNNKLKIRHRIEEKNGEMKTAHGLSRADSTGLVAMRLQAYLTAFTVNVKRIVALSNLVTV